MTSHYRHRRTSNPATAFSNPLEPGEIAANTANRQIAVGDAAAGAVGVPLALIAVRFFDVRAVYAVGDFVVQAGNLYRCKTAITTPAAFNAAQWDVISTDVSLKTYIDTQDAAITTAYQSADTTLQTNINGKVSKTGDSMSGPLIVPTPTQPSHAATKQYVDDNAGSGGGGGGGTAAEISNVPAGNIQATNVQNALNELDAEKVAANGGAFTGPNPPTSAAAPPANDISTKLITSGWYGGQAGTSNPLMNGAVAVGVSFSFARQDHVHPTDTTRAPIFSPDFRGLGSVPMLPTPAGDPSTDQIATCKFVIDHVGTIPVGSISYQKLDPNDVATAAQFLSGAANKLLTSNRVWL